MSDATVPNEKPLGFIDAEPAQPVTPSNESSNNAGDEDAAATRSDRARHSGYHSRFVAVYIALALVAGLGVGALVASLVRDDPAPVRTTAAQFKPSQNGELGAADLAESVERKYRLANGAELAGVVATRNTLQDGTGGFYRVRFQVVQPFDATADPDTKFVTADNAIQYNLCGSGASCEIPGTASRGRFGLLQRQGLELRRAHVPERPHRRQRGRVPESSGVGRQELGRLHDGVRPGRAESQPAHAPQPPVQ